MLKKLKLQNDNQENNLFNNMNDYVIKIDYFDNNGSKKKNYIVPLKYIFNHSSHMSNKHDFCVN